MSANCDADRDVWVSVWSHGPMDVFATKDAAMAWNVARPRELTWDEVTPTDLHGYVEGSRMVQVHRRIITQDHPRNIAPPTPAPQGPDVEAHLKTVSLLAARLTEERDLALAALAAEKEAHARTQYQLDGYRQVVALGTEQLATAESALAAALADRDRLAEIAATFRAKHERFHPDHWVAAKSDKYCDACDFCAALATPQAPTEP